MKSYNEIAGEVADETAGEVAGKAAGEVAGEAAGEVAGEAAGEVAGEDIAETISSPLTCVFGDISGPMLHTSQEITSAEELNLIIDHSAMTKDDPFSIFGHWRQFSSEYKISKVERQRASQLIINAKDDWNVSEALAILSHAELIENTRLIEPVGRGFWLASLSSIPHQLPLGSHILRWQDKFDHALQDVVNFSVPDQGLTARFTLWAESKDELTQLLKHPSLQVFTKPSSQLLLEDYADREMIVNFMHTLYQSSSNETQPVLSVRYTSPPRHLAIETWRTLALHPRVILISGPEIKPVILNAPSRDIMGIDAVTEPAFLPGQRSPRFQGWTGEGVRVAIMDSGVALHPDFYMYDEQGDVIFDRVRGDLPPGEWDSHGTTVAGILAGNGYASVDHTSPLGLPNQPFQWRGQAPMVREIQSYLMFGTGNASDAPPWAQMFDQQQAHLANHSHTFGNGYYTNEPQGYDAFISGVMINDDQLEGGGLIEGQDFTTPPRPIFLSAGNNGLYPQENIFMRLHGYYGLLVNLKNGILVGSVESNDAQPSDFSSLGPTLDGRLKPDIMAPGSSDERPLSGFEIDLGEIRLHAKSDSGLPDAVWKWGRSHPSLNSWTGEGAFGSDVVTLNDGVLTGETFGSYATRIAWSRTEEGSPLDAENYDSISYEYRVRLPDDSAYDPLSTVGRKDIETSHASPRVWMFRWGDDVGRGYDETRFLRHTEVSATGEWSRVTYRFDEEWNGEISRLRITPAIYWGGVYTTSMWGGYDYVSGTSMASPAAAGVGATALQQLTDQHDYDLESNPPSPALMRGLMVQSARDLSRTQPPPRASNNPDTGFPSVYGKGPDFNTGYGLLDAESMSRLIDDSVETPRWLESTINPGEFHRIRIQVTDAGPLRVTLTWDDPPGSIITPSWESKLIHDLDLAVLSPDGKVHGPWVLSPPPLKIDDFEGGEDELDVIDIPPARYCVVEDFSSLWQTASNTELAEENENQAELTSDLIYAPRGNARCVDDLNPIEQVEIEVPKAGIYDIVIKRTEEMGGPQKYSLIWSQRCPLEK